jgi:hypothetical protein
MHFNASLDSLYPTLSAYPQRRIDLFKLQQPYTEPTWWQDGSSAHARHRNQHIMDESVLQKRVEIKEYLHQNVHHGAVTAHGWTSIDQRKFFGITFHFVTPKYTMGSIVIGMERIEGSQTAESLLNAFSKYGRCVVTSRASVL